MWGNNVPYYEYQHSKRRPNTTKDDNASLMSVPVHGDASMDHFNSPSIADLLEPAVDGPPSPERLRQLSKQMKRASHLHRQTVAHRTVSSSSSSIHSFSADRTPWESALDNLALVRRPSDRSTDSSTPSRDRPESVQVFGKNLFSIRGRSKRESSSHSSSGNSSLYSAEFPPDNSGHSISHSHSHTNGTAATLKESLMPTLFARRKPSRDDSAQRKLQISGPFNFQHVTHTQRENIPSFQRGSRMELAAEFSAMRTPGPTSAPGALRGIEAREIQLGGLNADGLADLDDAPLTAPVSRPALNPRIHTAPVSGTRRMMKQARSQDHLRSHASPPRVMPSRPPRSPMDVSIEASLPPVPPPRVSSRQSLHLDAFASATQNRPQTSGGFHRPQPFNPSEASPERSPPPATSHGYVPTSDFETFGVKENRLSQAPSSPDSSVAWPLATPPTASFESQSPLADVPEEEEVFGMSRQSRLSLASNNSSLRGSQSVPMLRSFSQSQRPMSGASETLGRFDMVAAQRAMRAGAQEEVREEPKSGRESWEDDIDYCYEHEAEADCDYQWERPSLEGGRHSNMPPVTMALADDELVEVVPITAHSSRSASQSDVPTLSPPRSSPKTAQDTVSPMGSAMASNFSKKGHRPSMLKPMRPISVASSFKESQGFTLSPSLLIPGDYHQQMLQSEVDRHKLVEGEESTRAFNMANFDGSSRLAKSPLMNEQRSSTSTTETNSTSHSDSTGERHVSANSTWTTLTHLTSSTSLNKMAGSFTDSAEPLPHATHFDDADEAEYQAETRTEKELTPPCKDTVPELTSFPPSMGVARKVGHKSHVSESLARGDAPAAKSAEALMMRRPRARTTSLSTQQAPPMGQYALFPRQFVKNNSGDRI